MKRVIKLFIAIVLFAQFAVADSDVNQASVNELQGMLNNIEVELEARGVSVRDKEGRIKKAESRMQRIVNKGSWKNAIIGSVLAAAVTAHPAGLLVGGVAGGMVGKSKDYEKVEERMAMIEREILMDEDDFLSEEEMRLARFSGDLDNASAINSETGNTAIADDNSAGSNPIAVEVVNNEVEFEQPTASINLVGPQKVEQRINVAQAPFKVPDQTDGNTMQKAGAQRLNSRIELESCYGRSAGDRKSREDLPHCFYMMY